MSRSRSGFNQTVKKFALSAFVVVAFIASATRESLTNSSAPSAASNASEG